MMAFNYYTLPLSHLFTNTISGQVRIVKKKFFKKIKNFLLSDILHLFTDIYWLQTFI
jgi:hypothetical protein